MFLTKEEEKMLDGEYGEATRLAMRLIVKVGEALGAQKLININSAQVSGVSYKNIGDPGIQLLEDLVRLGGKSKILSTLNPAGMDIKNWEKMGIPKEFAEKQLKIISLYMQMDILPTCSCIPYLIGNSPKYREHVAWAESSAVTYANSVLGARTNREGGPLALASALTGKTAFYGFHMEENRFPTHYIELKAKLRYPADYSILGYVVGKKIKTGVPLFSYTRMPPDTECLKALSAGLATSGSISLFHIENYTIEAIIKNKQLQDGKSNMERIIVEEDDIKPVFEEYKLTTNPDLIYIGCPHASIQEIGKIAQMLRNRKIQGDIEFWVGTAANIKILADRAGYTDIIEKSGGKIITDTCIVVSPLKTLGFQKILTNSAKACYYLTGLEKLDVGIATLEEIIKTAVEGI